MSKLDNKIRNLDTKRNKEIKEIQNELENAYKIISEKKEETNKLNILIDRLIKEKKEIEEALNEYKNELNEYENELHKVNDTHS